MFSHFRKLFQELGTVIRVETAFIADRHKNIIEVGNYDGMEWSETCQ